MLGLFLSLHRTHINDWFGTLFMPQSYQSLIFCLCLNTLLFTTLITMWGTWRNKRYEAVRQIQSSALHAQPGGECAVCATKGGTVYTGSFYEAFNCTPSILSDILPLERASHAHFHNSQNFPPQEKFLYETLMCLSHIL